MCFKTDFLVLLRSENNNLREFEFLSLMRTYNLKITNFKKICNLLYSFSTSKKEPNFKKNDNLNLNEIVKTDFSFLSRSAFTDSVYKIIEIFDINNVEENFKDLEVCFKGSFAVRVKRYNLNYDDLRNNVKELKRFKDFDEKYFAAFLWEKSIDKKVDLINPNNYFFFFIFYDKIIFTKLVFRNIKEFLKRMPKKRLMNNPYTLKSDLARALINFLQIKKGLVLDPFCGFGGILLELEALKFKYVGIDIKFKDIMASKKNIYYFFKKNPCLIVSDFNNNCFRKETFDGIVTDIPYGKSTKVIGNDLYINFVNNSYRILKKNRRLIAVCSNYIDLRSCLEKKFVIEKVIKEYINKSMTRIIYICRKD